MGLPLFVPTRRWMWRILWHAVTHTGMNWWHLREKMVSGAVPTTTTTNQRGPLPFAPWVSGGPPEKGGGLQQIAYWYELTDFAQMPHVIYFESIPELLALLRTVDVPAVRARMRRFSEFSLKRSVRF